MSEETGKMGVPAPKGGLSRWAWAGIIASLALNLMVVGAVAGSFWAHHKGHWGGPHFMHGEYSFFQGLSKERRRELKKITHESKVSVRPLWKAVKKARRKAAEIMRADLLDEVAFKSALEDLSLAEINARKSTHDMVLKVASQLNAEERLWFTKKFLRRWGRHRHGRHRRY